MKLTGVKTTTMSLRLTARDAARRFLLIGGCSVSEGAWKPTPLRWRRRRKFTTPKLIRQVSPSKTIMAFPQFHFHVGGHTNVHTRTVGLAGGLATLPPAATMIVQNFKVARIAQASAARTVEQEPRSNRGAISTTRVPTRRAGTAACEMLVERSRPYPMAELRPRLNRAIFLKTVASRRNEHRTAAGIVEPSGIAGPSVRQFEEQAPFYISRRTGIRTPFSKRIAGNKVHQPLPPKQAESLAVFHRTEELVWKRVVKTVTEFDEMARRNVSDDPTQESSHQAVMNERSIPAASGPAEQSVPEAIAKLDPALVDRVADTVIRKVEQRMRIERERRGLL